ncbi:hypothetical protein ABIF78_002610 [Bradyrhizobium japonicum]
MAQIVRLARGALHGGAVLFQRGAGRAARVPERFDRGDVLFEPGKGVEQAAVGGGIDQRALVMLAVDLDQGATDRLQRLHADRLVVDERAGAAVGELHPAENHLAGIIQAVLGQNPHRRVIFGDIEDGGDLPLLRAMAHEAGVAAAAERQRKGIEQDGFARTGLTGQNRKSGGEFDIEPLDQDDVTDRQTRQHGIKFPSRDYRPIFLKALLIQEP